MDGVVTLLLWNDGDIVMKYAYLIYVIMVVAGAAGCDDATDAATASDSDPPSSVSDNKQTGTDSHADVDSDTNWGSSDADTGEGETESHSDVAVCTAGEIQRCDCLSGEDAGVRQCNAGGDGWRACVCDGSDSNTSEDTDNEHTPGDSETESGTETLTAADTSADTHTDTDSDRDTDGYDSTHIDEFPLWCGVGGDNGEDDAADRKLVAVESDLYILQNNYWGASNGFQELAYRCNNDNGENAFEIVHVSGSAQGSGWPLSFPSFYVGQHGDKNVTTTTTDHLPLRIDSISSAESTFKWNGQGLDDANVSYDIWFSGDNPPYGGEAYNEAVSGSVEIWLHKPGGRQPRGEKEGTASLCGYRFDVWAGASGASVEHPDLPVNRPVISYVVQGGDVEEFSCDLKEVLNDATGNTYGNYAIPASWYLTDIIAGFEIWSGYPVGSSVEKFTVAVD